MGQYYLAGPHSLPAILRTHHLEGLLTYTFERQERVQTRYVGRGRGSATRPQQVTTTVRYQITGVAGRSGLWSDPLAKPGGAPVFPAFITQTKKVVGYINPQPPK
jgi:hypothetical protein